MQKYFYINFCLLFFQLSYFTAQKFQNAPSLAPRISINFKENKGQIYNQHFEPRPDILFSGEAKNYNFYLKKNGISYQFSQYSGVAPEKSYQEQLRDVTLSASDIQLDERTVTIARLDISWLNCNENASIVRGDRRAGYENHYNEACPNGAIAVRSYENVTYENLYEGISLKWYSKNQELKYDYEVEAGANYKQIQLQVSGADKISINSSGELLIETALGSITEARPYVTQNGSSLNARWIKLSENVISFDISGINANLPFTIDPLVRYWGTYFGGSSYDESWNLHVDRNNNIYIVGETHSQSNIATTGAHQISHGSMSNISDAFIAKFNTNGLLLWASYYGGSAKDYGAFCVTDTLGNVYFGGGTSSTNTAVIATPGSHQTNFTTGSNNAEPNDAFLVKLDSNGVRVWSTYYGGNKADFAYAGTVDFGGNIFITGRTKSNDGNTIATLGSHQSVYGGALSDAFLVKFNSLGQRIWGTYYGGSNSGITWQGEIGQSCSTDNQGNIYLAGATDCPVSLIMATPGSHQFTQGSGIDGFLVKFDANGQRIWATFYGGGGLDYINSCLVKNDTLYISGTSITVAGTNIATPGTHQPNWSGGNDRDAFVAKFDLNGVRQWGTYYGGTSYDEASNCDIDAAGNILVFGQTNSTNTVAIATSCTYQETFQGTWVGFVAKLSHSGQRIWGTYVGINRYYWVYGAVDSDGDIIIESTTVGPTNTVFATSGAHQPNYGGGSADACLMKFDACIQSVPVNNIPTSSLLFCKGTSKSITTNFCGATWYLDSLSGVSLNADTLFTPLVSSDTTFYLADNSCGIGGPRTAIQVSVNPLPNVSIVSTSSLICYEETATLTAFGANSYTWNNAANTSTLFINPVVTWNYTVTGIDSNNCVNTATFTQHVGFCAGIEEYNIQNDFFIAPNPTAGEVNLTATKFDQDVAIEITNTSGQIILKQKGATPLKIRFESQPNGLYFIRIQTLRQTDVTLKVLKN